MNKPFPPNENKKVDSKMQDKLNELFKDQFATELRSTSEIPEPYQCIFAEYRNFNRMQSYLFDDILYTDNSIVVSAPTGSGKTVVFEIAIVRFLIAFAETKFKNIFKIVYVSPTKALCEERVVDWHAKFSRFGLNCIAVTGDSENINFDDLIHQNLIITTPEKWDSLSRKWRDNKKFVEVVKLFMIDEVHLLNEEVRGATLETIVCRMKTVQDSQVVTSGNDFKDLKIRFIALSATIPNVSDISKWIGGHTEAKCFKFSENIRPVPLKKIVLGYNHAPQSSPFKFDMMLSYKLQKLILEHSEGKPTLIFCSTRKSVEMTAQHVIKSVTANLSPENKAKILEACSSITDNKIKNIIIHGVAYHHGGLLVTTRHCIEDLFRKGLLPILVTTSTLATGVNLPAHLVIIKSTKCYMNGGFEDYPPSSILQMIGRAGRPQFDTHGTALILTTLNDKNKYENILEGCQKVESNLHRHLTEHLNSEVVLRTITDLGVAMEWLSSTFLYIRARENPKHYGFSTGLTAEQIDRKLLEICKIELNKLNTAGMLTIDENVSVLPTNNGQIMAKYCLAFETMKLFTQLTGHEIIQQLLSLISKCDEFKESHLRVNEKKCLNFLNNTKNAQTIRFPLSGRIKTLNMKINCVIQAVFGCLEIEDHSILSETFRIMKNGERIAKCLVEFLETKSSNCFQALLSAVTLSKCFHAQLWENSQFICKQFPGIGASMSRQMVNAGKTSFAKIENSNPREIELILKKKPPMGDKIIELASNIPKYNLEFIELKENGSSTLKISVDLTNSLDLENDCTVNLDSVMCLIIGDNLNNILLYERYMHSYMTENPQVTRFIPLDSKNMDLIEIYAHFISEDWVGFDCYKLYYLPNRSNNAKNTPKNDQKVGPKSVQTFLDDYLKSKKKILRPRDTKAEPALKKLKSSDDVTSKNVGPKKNQVTPTVTPLLKNTAKNTIAKMDIPINRSLSFIDKEPPKNALPKTNNIKIVQNILLKKNVSKEMSFEKVNKNMQKEEIFRTIDKEKAPKNNNLSPRLTRFVKEPPKSISPKNNHNEVLKNCPTTNSLTKKQSFEENNKNVAPEKMFKHDSFCLDNIIDDIFLIECENETQKREKLKSNESNPILKKHNFFHNDTLSMSDELFKDIEIPTKTPEKERLENKTAPQTAPIKKPSFAEITAETQMEKSILLKYTQDKSKTKQINSSPLRLPKNIHVAPLKSNRLFEASLINDQNSETKSNVSKFGKFSVASQDVKKFSHNPEKMDKNSNFNRSDEEIEQRLNDLIEFENRRNGNASQKSISWRNPLTYSPPVKFSPKKSRNFHNDSLTSSSSKSPQFNNKKLKQDLIWQFIRPKLGHSKGEVADFPISDSECQQKGQKDTSAGSDDKSFQLDDLVSPSFLESLRRKSEPNLNDSQKTVHQTEAVDYYTKIMYRKNVLKRNTVETDKKPFYLNQSQSSQVPTVRSPEPKPKNSQDVKNSFYLNHNESPQNLQFSQSKKVDVAPKNYYDQNMNNHKKLSEAFSNSQAPEMNASQNNLTQFENRQLLPPGVMGHHPLLGAPQNTINTSFDNRNMPIPRAQNNFPECYSQNYAPRPNLNSSFYSVDNFAPHSCCCHRAPQNVFPMPNNGFFLDHNNKENFQSQLLGQSFNARLPQEYLFRGPAKMGNCDNPHLDSRESVDLSQKCLQKYSQQQPESRENPIEFRHPQNSAPQNIYSQPDFPSNFPNMHQMYAAPNYSYSNPYAAPQSYPFRDHQLHPSSPLNNVENRQRHFSSYVPDIYEQSFDISPLNTYQGQILRGGRHFGGNNLPYNNLMRHPSFESQFSQHFNEHPNKVNSSYDEFVMNKFLDDTSKNPKE